MKLYFILFALFVLPLQTNAALVELNSGSFSLTAGGESTGRGIGFQALSDFSIYSIGIYGDLNQESFDVQIYSSTDGNQANAVLASESSIVGGTGNGWNDIAINYSFAADSYYVLNWRPTDGGDGDWATTLDYYNDSALAVSISELAMLINGTAGINASAFDNYLHPNLRLGISAVPVPAAIWLFGTALGGLGGVSRRRTVVKL
ncbi:MAG TPA: VPLPA-CTERM sorting domain-containing protein [Gammaproteobacteria bacterium]|nr:VPLPA-CTERM sorting domain-containing protein [Gammaproteobacteria bacterium]